MNVISKTELLQMAIFEYTSHDANEELSLEAFEAMSKDERLQFINDNPTEAHEYTNENHIYDASEAEADEKAKLLKECGVIVVGTLSEAEGQKVLHTPKPTLTDAQTIAIRCAIADLEGAIDCMDYDELKAHKDTCGTTLGDLRSAFSDIN